MKKLFCVSVLIIALSGCAARPIHPGAANAFDSQSYDALIVAHSVIESTKTDLANNAFAPSITPNVKMALNGLIQAYNVADSAYQAYHSAALKGTVTAAQQTAVTDGLNQVSSATNLLTLSKKVTP